MRALLLFSRWTRSSRPFVLTALLCASELGAAETRPVLGPGATRDEVIDTYGWPNGQSQSGDREIFSYTQGRVVLKDGVVERMDFSPTVAWPVPRPRPKGLTSAQSESRKLAAEKPVVADPWITDYAAALAEAKQRDARILALFTGTDWSPASKKFRDEIALHPDFLGTVGREYVLLRLDFPRATTQLEALRVQNAQLRERFGVTSYPSVILLTTEGREFGRVDFSKSRPQATYREQFIAAIEEANPSPATATWLAAAAHTAAEIDAKDRATAVASRRKWWFFGAGALALGAAAWSLWIRRGRDDLPKAEEAVVPTVDEMVGWPHIVLRNVCAHLFGAEGKRVDLRAAESGVDLVVFTSAEKNAPKTLVRCLSGVIGPADLSSARDLLGTMIAEAVHAGWYVAPAGFAPEIKEFAKEHGILLIGGDDLRLRLQSVPPGLLARVLAPSDE